MKRLLFLCELLKVVFSYLYKGVKCFTIEFINLFIYQTLALIVLMFIVYFAVMTIIKLKWYLT